MTLKIESLPYGPDGKYTGLLAYPERAAKPLPAIIVIQEAWGVDEHIEDVTRRFALADRIVNRLMDDLLERRVR